MVIDDYQGTDPYFGKPFIDVDERREQPSSHRYVHGGFENTDTRFAIYFPDKPVYQGRFFQPLGGGLGGTEFAFVGPLAGVLGGVEACFRLGGYMLESNQGHFGNDLDQRAGNDPGLYGYRASAESARFAKHLATLHYGRPPHHGYVYGGSGGARRSPLCLENAADIYDGALPFMGGGPVAPGKADEPIESVQPTGFGAMFNVRRLLGDKLASVIDAMEPGGSGNPFEGLTTYEREALADLYRLGFPRGAEYMIAQPMGQAAMWCWNADDWKRQDPDYVHAFWNEKGYAGHDTPHLFEGDRIVRFETKVGEVRIAGDIAAEVMRGGPAAGEASSFMAVMSPPEKPIAIRLAGAPQGYLPGAGVRVTSGNAADRQLYVTGLFGDTLLLDGFGADGNAKAADIEPGDSVEVDNDAFLAYCHWHRHHIIAGEKGFDQVIVDNAPIFPQRRPICVPTPFGGHYSAQFEGKLLYMQHTHDTSLWPDQAILYAENVSRHGNPDNFRLQWVENAEHIPPAFLPSSIFPSPSSRLINYSGVIEQGLADLVAWVEEGDVPPASQYQYAGGKLTLPPEAKDRGGIQPVVAASANGASRADVKVDEPVTLVVVAEVPPNAGTIVRVEWDLDGSGTFPVAQDGVDATSTAIRLSTTHAYAKAGTYFPSVRVIAQRDGDVATPHRQIPNLARVRVVVS
ncbi:tannase/feruloyl esterase family alpha/beta hydrolase [Sphingomonas sp. KC8]|uniref:tannase/feruloyl esterase family alpha/beta hydrolase n=1 Tax=Sphingomonas sp. KC8 TaxID=1030157 RepID=UPI000248B598|nr:tannase/feruloyl esterase family alpha/beta hydrolase [Sphingomonas sp. KC8]ARS26942.1 hypothetical protein KC8_06520 [Sphingomonas sp. KC8]